MGRTLSSESRISSRVSGDGEAGIKSSIHTQGKTGFGMGEWQITTVSGHLGPVRPCAQRCHFGCLKGGCGGAWEREEVAFLQARSCQGTNVAFACCSGKEEACVALLPFLYGVILSAMGLL